MFLMLEYILKGLCHSITCHSILMILFSQGENKVSMNTVTVLKIMNAQGQQIERLNKKIEDLQQHITKQQQLQQQSESYLQQQITKMQKTLIERLDKPNAKMTLDEKGNYLS